MDAEAGSVLVDPAAQARPTADEHLVGNLDVLAAAGLVTRRDDEAGAGELVEDGGDVRGSGFKLAQRRPPAGVIRALARLGQTQEHPPSELLLLQIERREDLLGPFRNRALHAA